MTEYEYWAEVVARRLADEKEEAKHDCANCGERVGIPCLKVYMCKKFAKNKTQKTEQ